MFKNDTNYLDQHFLIDEKVIAKYIETINIQKNDIIVEIGAGKGVLTRKIAPLCQKLFVIELDKRLDTYLRNIDNIEIIYANVLDINIPKCNKIVTSLPYSIIEPFIKKMINTNFEELIILMGSNYINKVINQEITKLSVLTNSYFKTIKVLDVAPSSFDYPPKTLSSLAKITKITIEELNIKYKVYRLLYYYQDKKIKNALISIMIRLKGVTQKQAKNIVNNLNIPNVILETKYEELSNENLKVLDKCLNILH